MIPVTKRISHELSHLILPANNSDHVGTVNNDHSILLIIINSVLLPQKDKVPLKQAINPRVTWHNVSSARTNESNSLRSG